MKYKTIGKIAILFFIVSFLVVQLGSEQSVKAADTAGKYGIVIANAKGSYTFYDLNNSSDGSAAIEITSTGSIMVPLKQLVKLIPGLSYEYNSTKKTITVRNTNNGRKIVYTKNSKDLSYYSSAKAKAVKKTMLYKMYVSSTSSSVMVPMSSFKWILQTTGGCKYYSSKEMQSAGYDTYDYRGLILYNPYRSVTSIPKATGVTGISRTVKVTIPEGYSVAQTFDLLVKKGVCTSTDSLYDAIENYDFTYYPLVGEIKENENRCFKLEGYLYPDTYEFYRLCKPQDAIGKFLRITEARLTTAYREKAKEMGYSMDQILTVASIIEKETADKSKMPTIASVLYNRMNSKMKLQCDSSIYYVERYIKPYIGGDINRYNSYYNTYKCTALPAGPICNPGMAAIKAALYPETTDYLYFYSDSVGEYHFSHDYVNPDTINNTGNTGNTVSTDSSSTADSTGSINE